MNRKKCNVCGCGSYTDLLNLGKQPLADTFLKKENSEGAETYYPLVLVECNECGHVFTKYQISPAERYIDHDYSYDSSNSPVAERHFEEFAAHIISTYNKIFGEGKPRTALDFGSNVGTLLSYIKAYPNMDVIGVEPSPNIAKIANNNNIKTVCELFDTKLVGSGMVPFSSVDIVVSTNVVNHMDDLEEMMRTIDKVGTPELMFAFEVPYLLDILRKNSFDTAYHEHVNYFNIASIEKLLDQVNFSLIHVEMTDYMGGSIRAYAVRKCCEQRASISPMLKELKDTEINFYSTHSDWRNSLRSGALKIKRDLLRFVQTEVAKGHRICAIGAATKGNTLLNYCGLDKDSIGVCCDVSELKVGKVLPGSGIPIVHDDELGSGWKYGIVLPWNLSDYIIKKFMNSGMTLIFPIQGVPSIEGGGQ